MADVMINRALSGHIYYRSPYEGYDDCGTCDGGRCDSCYEMFEVTDFDKPRSRIVGTKEEALKLKAEWEFENSIENARNAGVPEEEIIHSIKELDRYMME